MHYQDRPSSPIRYSRPGSASQQSFSGKTRPVSAPYGGYGGHPSRGGRQRPRKPRSGLLPGLFVFLLLAALILGALSLIRVYQTVADVENVFCPGVYINNISVGGLTWNEALTELRSMASQRLDATYTFTYEDQSWDFSPSQVGASLNIEEQAALGWNFAHVGNLATKYKTILQLRQEPVYYKSTLTYHEELIDEFIEEIRAAIDSEPVNALVVADVGGPKVARDSTNGRRLDTAALRENLTNLVVNGTGDTALTVETLYPDLTSDDANQGMQKLVRYRTDTSFRGPKSLANVKLALSRFNGLVVYPGDTVDFNALAGKRTEENGYQEAPEYAGNRTTNGIGGGVCQAATTMYGAMLKAGMTILERSPHTMTVSYVDPSLDAAVSDTGKNLVFRNDRDSAIYIYTEVTSQYATVYVYGQKTEYRYELESHLRSTRATYDEILQDFSATYVTYVDEQKVVSNGKMGCTSEGYLVSYDWETGEEVSRTLLTKDSYSPSPRIIYVGISPRVGLVPDY